MSSIFDKGIKDAAKSQERAEAARIAAADPERLQRLLFGGPEVPGTTLISGKGNVSFLSPGSLASTGIFPQLLRGFAPQFDELSRAGGTAQSGVATNLARRGLSGTGIGESLRNASQFIPGQLQFQGKQQVFQEALNAVLSLMGAQAGVPIGARQPVPSTSSQIAQLAASFFLPLGISSLGGNNQGVPDNRALFQ